MKKQFITTALALTIALSSFTGVFAESQPLKEETGINEGYTFELFQDEMKKDLGKTTVNEAKAAFEKATKLDKKAESLWNQLYSLDIYEDYDEDEDEDVEYKFEDIKSELRKDLSDKQIKEANELFGKAMGFELEGDIEKADDMWKKLEDGNYFDEIIEGEVCKVECFEVDNNVVYDDIYDFSEFAKQFKSGITSDVKDKVEKIYDEMVKFENEGKYEEANDKMIEIFGYDVFEKDVNELLDSDTILINDDNFEMKFEDFAEILKKDISKADMKKAENLFDEATKAEKEAEKAWNELYNMDIFLDNDGKDEK